MTTSDPDLTRVHTYWFGDGAEADTSSRSKLWFNGGTEVDDHIRQNFGDLVVQGIEGQLMHWCATPKGTVALIVVLDQFPLNAYRKTAQAFAGEAQAVDICLQGLARGDDRQLSVQERLFFYLPLSHSEAIEHQDQAVALFEQQVADADAEQKEFAGMALESAIEHREQIRQFGRYPFRNDVLGRESTAEELAWLGDNPSRYGQ